MKSFYKKFAIILFGIILFLAILFVIWQTTKKTKIPETKTQIPPLVVEVKTPNPQEKVLGLSVEGRKIESYVFGQGKTQLVFAGGIHGGYEWNSVLLMYELIDYLAQNLESIPDNLTVTIIPSLNPDGVFKVVGKSGRFTAADISAKNTASGRLNANGVDLNRNFDCNWQPEGIWQGNKVSAGTKAFSEPESAALKKFVLEANPSAIIFWHSKSNAIYGSQCNGDMLLETKNIMDIYSKASGYKTVATFDQYQVTGDASDWLALIGKPSMTIELSSHESLDWEKNINGIKALFEYYKNKN